MEFCRDTSRDQTAEFKDATPGSSKALPPMYPGVAYPILQCQSQCTNRYSDILGNHQSSLNQGVHPEYLTSITNYHNIPDNSSTFSLILDNSY